METEEQYKTKRERIGELLMEAFNLSFDTADVYMIGDVLKKAIDALELPSKACSECGSPMSFFGFHLNQGICGWCSERWMSEQDED